MNRHSEGNPVGMRRGSTLRIDDGAGTTIHVREGELWLTEEGGGEDFLLGAGEHIRLARNGAAVAHALRRSVVSLDTGAGTPARRVLLLRPGPAGPAVLSYEGRSSVTHALHRIFENVLAAFTRTTNAIT